MIIVTDRLVVSALPPEELSMYLSGRGVEPDEFEYINNMLTELLADESKYLFHTIWVGIDKDEQRIVCELVLKGEPVDGEVEIGYRSFESNKGYMTEMVNAVAFWAKENGLTLTAKATNPASERVLEKNGFKKNDCNIYKL